MGDNVFFLRGQLQKNVVTAIDVENVLDASSVIKDKGVFYVGRTPEEVGEIRKPEEPFNKKKWSPWRKLNFEFYKRELAKLPNGNTLFDLGAGYQPFKELYGPFQVVAADFNYFPEIDIVCDLDRKLPFKDSVADIVIHSNVLEHLPYPIDFTRECYRILKKGGTLLATVPFIHPSHMRPFDFHRYTDIGLHTLLEDAGFTNIEITPLGTPFDVLYHMSHKFFIRGYNTEYSKNKSVQRLYLYGFALLERFHNMAMRFYRRLSVMMEPTPVFTEGFAIRAERR